MQNRDLHKTMRGQYVPATWTGKNESGWRPTGAMVLVKPDRAADKIGSLLMTDTNQELVQLAAEAGTIVALGPVAFVWADRERTTRWEGSDKPNLGDRVSFQRYSGLQVNGDDGELYFAMNDYCIGAVRSAEAIDKALAKASIGVADAMHQARRANSRM